MKISIVIATLNEEKYLRQCLESLNNQDNPSFEIIIGDGGSTDTTLKIAEKYADKIIIEKKPTIAAGRQAAAMAADGEIIAFTDADAVHPKDWLSKLTAPLNDKIVSTHGPVHLIGPTEMEKILVEHFLTLYLRVTNKMGIPSGAGSNLAVTRSAFDRVGGFDTDLTTAEDVELQKRLAKIGKILFVPEAVVYVSPRRLRKWGYVRFISFRADDWLRNVTNRRPKIKCEPVR